MLPAQDFVRMDNTHFAEPRNRYYPMTESWSRGSANVNDVSTDLNTHNWFCYLQDNAVYIRREDGMNGTKLFDWAQPITELDFCFDQAARPVCVFVSDNTPYLYSFVDTRFSFTKLDKTIRHPRIALDHLRLIDAPVSDIILGYCHDGKLCYRVQRERYNKEYVIAEHPNHTLLWRIGLTKDERFGFEWR